MNEPVSMLDWGLDHVGVMLTNIAEHHLKDFGVTMPAGMAYVLVDYNYSTNQIIVSEPFGSDAKFAGPPKDTCKRVLNGIRQDLGYYPEESMKPLPFWVDSFRHTGFTDC